jgi:8-oxo-dGTP diphosphatase
MAAEDVLAWLAMEPIPQFGEPRPDVIYRVRPSAYALIRGEDGRLLLCRTPRLVTLPGGGIDSGETPEAAMVREVAEETGLVVTSAKLLCLANQYAERTSAKPCVNKLGYFFVASAEDRGLAPEDDDHECLWLKTAEAQDILSHSAHRWAVSRLDGT